MVSLAVTLDFLHINVSPIIPAAAHPAAHPKNTPAQHQSRENHLETRKPHQGSRDSTIGRAQHVTGNSFGDIELTREGESRPNVPLQEKFHRRILRGVRNISDTP